MSFKDKVLSSSNQFNYYKDNYEKLLNENKQLKQKQKQLIEENEQLIKEFELNKQIIINKENLSTESNYCPYCGRISNFEPYGVVKREKAMCPYCKSLERHRLIYLFFERNYSSIFKNKDIKLLHFAPERIFYNYFTQFDHVDYYPVDIDPETYAKRGLKLKRKVNMEEVPYDDEEFDFIYNSHVLEHVPDDFKAMGELYRVLKQDGVCITVVPLSGNEETLEKEEYNTPELREKHYGNKDHLRFYGLDVKQRLESVGFKVKVSKLEDLNLTEKEIELFNVKESLIFVCTK